MKNLVLVGAGSFGREILTDLRNCIGYETEFTFKGFIDNDLSRLDDYGMRPLILSLIADYQPAPEDVFLCTITDSAYRKQYVERIEARGGEFITLVHQSSSIGDRTTIGRGCYIARHSVVSCDVTLGDFVIFNGFGTVGHDSVLHDFCNLGAYAMVAGRVEVGAGTTLHPHCTILPSKKIGKNCVIGAGSVVIRSVGDGTSVFGVPAKRI